MTTIHIDSNNVFNALTIAEILNSPDFDYDAEVTALKRQFDRLADLLDMTDHRAREVFDNLLKHYELFHRKSVELAFGRGVSQGVGETLRVLE